MTHPHTTAKRWRNGRRVLIGCLILLLTATPVMAKPFNSPFMIMAKRDYSENGGISLDEAREQRQATIPARRYGTAEEFGAMCAFLCSQHAGFIVGQNILLDGGAINSTL